MREVGNGDDDDNDDDDDDDDDDEDNRRGNIWNEMKGKESAMKRNDRKWLSRV